MRFQCPTPFLALAITPLRSASIAIWQALRTAPYRHDRTVTLSGIVANLFVLMQYGAIEEEYSWEKESNPLAIAIAAGAAFQEAFMCCATLGFLRMAENVAAIKSHLAELQPPSREGI